MPISRYDEREILINDSYDYMFSDIFHNRNVAKIAQYTTAELPDPVSINTPDVDIETKVWTVGTKYYNLANEFYGSPEYWWIIAWYNLRPLETDFKPGDVVEIPTPLETVLSSLDML